MPRPLKPRAGQDTTKYNAIMEAREQRRRDAQEKIRQDAERAKNQRTMADQIEDIVAGRKTAEEIVATEDMSEYGISYFYSADDELSNVDDAHITAWHALRRAYRNASSESTVQTSQSENLVRCDCGHDVPRELVMAASLGSSCPDCYDRMSD